MLVRLITGVLSLSAFVPAIARSLNYKTHRTRRGASSQSTSLSFHIPRIAERGCLPSNECTKIVFTRRQGVNDKAPSHDSKRFSSAAETHPCQEGGQDFAESLFRCPMCTTPTAACCQVLAGNYFSFALKEIEIGTWKMKSFNLTGLITTRSLTDALRSEWQWPVSRKALLLLAPVEEFFVERTIAKVSINPSKRFQRGPCEWYDQRRPPGRRTKKGFKEWFPGKRSPVKGNPKKRKKRKKRFENRRCSDGKRLVEEKNVVKCMRL